MSQVNGVSNGMPNSQAPTKAAEIAWTFVPQYYTCMNQNPSRLHCFYTKQSTLVHADEKEDAQPSYGQQEIHKRLEALNLEDTKVYVSTVDCQASADGGIIIQVIGELSNRGEDWRKFSQTFFLAQQPNGYYVLNDIFRYLSNEDDQEEPAEEDIASRKEPSVETSIPIATEAAGNTTEAVPESKQASSATLGVEPAPAIAEAASTPAQVASTQTQATEAGSGAQAAQAAQAEQPAARKTWANLAANGARKWDTSSRASTPSAAPTAQAAKPAVTSSSGPTVAGGANANANAKPARNQHAASSGTQVFVKNVTPEHAQNDALKNVITSQFGATKECQVNGSKGFAFVEFVSADAARKAIAAGQVQVGNSTVVIEKRRANERGNPPRGRGGSYRGGRGGHANLA
ncbi:hypothetical protein MPSI1_001039 [Malassezia psittaci]|uniref:G3BP-like protein n=1 Tax=Malassezia psittaci TaxID=1821823 RepID=A0AAF0F3R5_9BASI|nr:hypothetical protein MPSI1_001039 [Malassezia psittaci]